MFEERLQKETHVYVHSLQEERLKLSFLNPRLKSPGLVAMHVAERQERFQPTCTPVFSQAAASPPTRSQHHRVLIDPISNAKPGTAGFTGIRESSAGSLPLPLSAQSHPATRDFKTPKQAY